MKNSEQIKKNGIIIRPDEVPYTVGYGCRTKLLLTPAMGSGLTGCQIIYCRPGETYTVHSHPASEDVTEVFKGKGQAFLGDFWYEVGEGEVIYAPESVKHGIRNPAGNTETLVCYNWQVPYFSDTEQLYGAADQLFEGQKGKVISIAARSKFDARIPDSGVITHIDRGALFTEYGAPMRFVVWTGMGSRKISLHRAKHPPGLEFHVHVHPDSEDTILAYRGDGQGYLVDRWLDMKEGDVLHAPRGVTHGTRNHRRSGGDFICTGAAAPPQADLYRIAGYL